MHFYTVNVGSLGPLRVWGPVCNAASDPAMMYGGQVFPFMATECLSYQLSADIGANHNFALALHKRMFSSPKKSDFCHEKFQI